jgi:hypothetical protein
MPLTQLEDADRFIAGPDMPRPDSKAMLLTDTAQIRL